MENLKLTFYIKKNGLSGRSVITPYSFRRCVEGKVPHVILCMHAQSLSHVQLCVTPWTVACQTPLARILEWIAISCSMRSFQSMNWTCISCLSCTGLPLCLLGSLPHVTTMSENIFLNDKPVLVANESSGMTNHHKDLGSQVVQLLLGPIF